MLKAFSSARADGLPRRASRANRIAKPVAARVDSSRASRCVSQVMLNWSDGDGFTTGFFLLILAAPNGLAAVIGQPVRVVHISDYRVCVICEPIKLSEIREIRYNAKQIDGSRIARCSPESYYQKQISHHYEPLVH